MSRVSGNVGQAILLTARKEDSMNNVNVDAIRKFHAEVEENPAAARKEKVIAGTWNFEEGTPQYEAVVEFAAGSETLATDQAPFMGGYGGAPDPVQYCLYGMSACYAGTIAAIAATEGIALKQLRVTARNRIDLRKSLGLSEDPIIQGVSLTVEAEPGEGVTFDEVRRVARLAEERCPGIECMRREIPNTIDVEPI
jgi:uncharacterized OsmC-like protein